MIGQILNKRYQITKILGQRENEQTFLAEDTKGLNIPLCIIQQLEHSFSEPFLLTIARRLFNREAENLQRLGKHDRIPGLLAYFEKKNKFYLVQEYIKGQTLERELIFNCRMAEEQVITMLRELLEILNFIQQNYVVHGNIKPANILRRERDRKLVLINFGAVKNNYYLSRTAINIK